MDLVSEYDNDMLAMESLLSGLDDGRVIDLTEPAEQLSAASLPSRTR